MDLSLIIASFSPYFSLLGVWDCGAGGGVAQKVARGLGQAGRWKHWSGIAICWSGVPHSRWTPKEKITRCQCGKSTQCSRWENVRQHIEVIKSSGSRLSWITYEQHNKHLLTDKTDWKCFSQFLFLQDLHFGASLVTFYVSLVQTVLVMWAQHFCFLCISVRSDQK